MPPCPTTNTPPEHPPHALLASLSSGFHMANKPNVLRNLLSHCAAPGMAHAKHRYCVMNCVTTRQVARGTQARCAAQSTDLKTLVSRPLQQGLALKMAGPLRPSMYSLKYCVKYCVTLLLLYEHERTPPNHFALKQSRQRSINVLPNVLTRRPWPCC